MAIIALAVAAVAASALLIPQSTAEAGSPAAGMNQSVSNYNDDILFRHGVHAWHESGYDGMTSTGTRLKVGIIDTGFDGWRMSARQGLLPNPPDLDDDDNTRVKTKCWILENDSWRSSDFEGCEAPNHGNPISDTHGTSVAETIAAIAPEVVFYISNAPDNDKQREAIEWMEDNDVVVINRSLHGNYLAPGNGTSYSDNSDIDNLKYVMEKSGSEVLFVNSAGNHGQVTWSGPYSDTNNNIYVDVRTVGGSDDHNYITLQEGDDVTVEMRWEDTWGTQSTAGATCNLNVGLYHISQNAWKEYSRQNQSGSNGDIPYDRMPFKVDTAADAGGYRVSIWRGNQCTDQPDWIQMRITGSDNGTLEYATQHGPLGNAPNDAHYQMASVQEATFNNANTDADYLVVTGSEPDFTKTTASNYGPTLGDDRQRPDIAASWCSNYNHAAGGIFCGTSQSAPVVSGLAVLIKEDDTTRTGKQIAAYLRGKADHANSGYDYGLGHGVAFLDGAALIKDDNGLPPALIRKNSTRTFRVLFSDPDATSGARISVGNNLSLNSSCTTTGRLSQEDADYGDTITIKGCSNGTSAITIRDATDSSVTYKSYSLKVQSTAVSDCDVDHRQLSAGGTWTAARIVDCKAWDIVYGQSANTDFSRLHTFSTPTTGAYKKYKFTLSLGGVVKITRG